MPSVKVFNQDGTDAGTLELSEAVFGVAPKTHVLSEVVRAMQAKLRRPIAHTKTRGEVRGGGKKPWRQKGTGRARHGSIRSPIWVGGGITFGPRSNRNFELKVNKKVRRAALRMGLSSKIAGGDLVVLNDLTATAYKTKLMAAMMKKLALTGVSTLVVLPGPNRMIAKSFDNLPKTEVATANALNLLEILKYKKLLTTKEAVEKITKQLT